MKHNYSAQDVADAFVAQYYHIMQEMPKDAYNFYKEQSIRSHQCADGSMKSAITLKGIHDEIMASDIKKWNPDLSTVHAEDSIMESVVVGVLGSLTDNADVARKFTQTFVLAPQEGGGFYVHNDFLQFVEIIITPLPLLPPDDVSNPPTAQHAGDPGKEAVLKTAHATNKDQTLKKDGDKVADSSKGKCIHPNMKEVARKVSYASILAKEGSGSSTTLSEKQTSVVHKPSVSPVGSSTIPNCDPLENIYDDKAIRVKDLPPNMTQESLLEMVKQFGPVKQSNIQIKEYEDGYRYAFVEFDDPKSARSAIETRFIHFEDRDSEIQYKILPNKGGHRCIVRSTCGRGGYKNNFFWGRGGDGQSSGSWGHKHNAHENCGQTHECNYRRNQDSQDRW